MRVYQGTFTGMVRSLLRDFEAAAEPVDVGQWQSVDIKGDRSKVTWELREAVLAIGMPDSIDEAQRIIRPNLPWAEDHFLERIGGKPLNPPPSQAWWPFAQQGHKAHVDGEGKFSHTYPERFWPKQAGYSLTSCVIDGVERIQDRRGIRFNYGDFQDVVMRLRKNPLTRQAYLPIWFPEDTGAPEGERVPCSLGYLFIVRGGKLHTSYYIRSCDFMRHWRDDVYMAIRLALEVRDQMWDVTEGLEMGELTMHIGSFHIFEGDRAMIGHLRRQADREGIEEIYRSLG